MTKPRSSPSRLHLRPRLRLRLRLITRVIAVAIACLLFACSAIVEPERFRVSEEDVPNPACPRFRNLDLTFRDLSEDGKPHGGDLFEYFVVDESSHEIVSLGTMREVRLAAGGPLTVHAPCSVPRTGSYRLDLYADANRSGGFDIIGISEDHAWSFPLVPTASLVKASTSTIRVDWSHTFSFVAIDKPRPAIERGLPLTVRFRGMQAFARKLMQLRVHYKDQVVGVLRIPRIGCSRPTPKHDITCEPAPVDAFEVTMRGVAEEGVTQRLDVYVDGNDNGRYDRPGTPGGDLGWSRTFTPAERKDPSDPTQGYVISFDPAAEPGTVDLGPL